MTWNVGFPDLLSLSVFPRRWLNGAQTVGFRRRWLRLRGPADPTWPVRHWTSGSEEVLCWVFTISARRTITIAQYVEIECGRPKGARNCEEFEHVLLITSRRDYLSRVVFFSSPNLKESSGLESLLVILEAHGACLLAQHQPYCFIFYAVSREMCIIIVSFCVATKFVFAVWIKAMNIKAGLSLSVLGKFQMLVLELALICCQFGGFVVATCYDVSWYLELPRWYFF